MSLNEERKMVHDLVLARYRANPQALQECLPDLAQVLDSLLGPKSKPRSPFGLTENERTEHVNEVKKVVVEDLTNRAVDKERAIRTLEHCAALIEDGTLPLQIDHSLLMKVLRAATGVATSSIKAETIIPVHESREKIVHSVAVVRGVRLNMTWDLRLVSISVQPSKFRERTRALRFVATYRRGSDSHARS